MRAHGKTTIVDALSGFVSSEVSTENYLLARSATEGADSHSESYSAVQSLRQFIGVRAEVAKAKINVLEELLEKVSRDDPAVIHDLQEQRDLLEAYASSFDGDSSEFSGDAKVFYKSVEETTRGDLTALLDHINSHDQAFQERANIYSDYIHEDAAKSQVGLPDNFRLDLLKHLAGSIVVKEHRIRYQKEQFDRYIASTLNSELKHTNVTLREFAKNYAGLIDVMIDSSHSGKCPKIEANYDDFAEQTIRPLNATIFYYYFSANRKGKTFAQWMLSSARYPNDRLRRAYMRFFA